MNARTKIQKIALTNEVLGALTFEHRPIGQNPDGTLITIPRADGMTDFFVRDSVLKGFSVRVTSNAKSFYAERKLAGRPCRKDCGSWPETSLAMARKTAKDALACMELGKDPNLEKKKAISEVLDARAKAKLTFGFVLARDAEQQLISDAKSTARDRRDVQEWTKSLPIWRVPVYEMVEQNSLEAMMDALIKERGGPSALKVWRYARVAWNRLSSSEQPSVDPFAEYLKAHRLPIIKSRNTYLPTDQAIGKEWLRRIAALRKIYSGHRPFAKRVMADFIILALCWGARRSEAASLTWGDVDFELKAIVFRGTKNGLDHVFPMTPGVEQILCERLADNAKPRGRDVRKAANGEPYYVPEWVFPSEKRGVHLVEPAGALHVGEEGTGLHVTMHDLRRTFAGDIAVDVVGDGSAKSKGDFGLVKLAMNHVDAKADITQAYITLRPKLTMLRPVYAVHEARVLTACGILAPPPAKAELDSLIVAMRANADDPVIVAGMKAVLAGLNPPIIVQ